MGLIGGFADGPDGVRTGEHFVAVVGLLVHVHDTELDPPGDGVEVGRDETAHVGEALAEVRVQTSGDGCRAEDELLE